MLWPITSLFHGHQAKRGKHLLAPERRRASRRGNQEVLAARSGPWSTAVLGLLLTNDAPLKNFFSKGSVYRLRDDNRNDSGPNSGPRSDDINPPANVAALYKHVGHEAEDDGCLSVGWFDFALVLHGTGRLTCAGSSQGKWFCQELGTGKQR